MKNGIIALAILVFIPFIFSCSAFENNKPGESAPAAKENKVVNAADKKKNKKSTKKKPTNEIKGNLSGTSTRANRLKVYAEQKGFSSQYCFLVNMNLPSGRNRFFVYDLEKNSVVYSGLVAHGSCNETFMSRPRFSNANGSGCSSLGKYKVGEFYRGKYGKSFRLHGLENSNSNAYGRAVVIHAYYCVPDMEIYPRVLCNSFGCPMVSESFFDRLSRIIDNSERPILLWIYR